MRYGEDYNNVLRFENEPHYRIIKFSKHERDKGIYTLQNIRDAADVKELPEESIVNNYSTLPPYYVRNRWERFQNRPILEGVWMQGSSQQLRSEVSSITCTIMIQLTYYLRNKLASLDQSLGE